MFNGTESSNADLVKKAGLQAHVICSPYLPHIKANLQSKVRAEFKMAQELNIVLPKQRVRTLQNNENSLKDTARQIMEDRRPIELELEAKRKQLKALVKVNPGSSFVQTMMGRSPRCYIPSFVEIGPPVPEKIFEGFYKWAWRPSSC